MCADHADHQPLTRWQRAVAHLLPWYDPAAQDARIARSAAIAAAVRQDAATSRERVRAAYRAYAERMERHDP